MHLQISLVLYVLSSQAAGHITVHSACYTIRRRMRRRENVRTASFCESVTGLGSNGIDMSRVLVKILEETKAQGVIEAIE